MLSKARVHNVMAAENGPPRTERAGDREEAQQGLASREDAITKMKKTLNEFSEQMDKWVKPSTNVPNFS